MNLTLSKRGDYVVRSAICLARAYESGATKKLREVSAEMGVPRTFVSQILGDLVRAGLATSSFGKDGGYRLAREPGQTSLLDVVEAAEGPLAPERCALGDGPCRWEAVCPLHETWGAATVSLRGVLASTSLAIVAQRDLAIEAGTYPVPADAHRLAAAVVVEDSVQVELAASSVATRLRSEGSWLAPFAVEADGEIQPAGTGPAGTGPAGTGPVGPGLVGTGSARVRVGPGGPAWLGKTVAVRLGEPTGSDDALVVPILWEATGPSGLFPRLDGELRLRVVDPDRSELMLAGHYRPPLGRAGQAIDEALLARLARATVRAFLRRVAHALEQAPAGHADRPVVPHRASAPPTAV
ncbi:MAG: Rrf2 family transcriptional regulator [Acidimicrobiales bacterium]